MLCLLIYPDEHIQAFIYTYKQRYGSPSEQNIVPKLISKGPN